jgi:hypothetical protein
LSNSGNFDESCTQCNIRENGRWFNCGCWTKYPKGTIQWDDIKERMKRTTIDLSKTPFIYFPFLLLDVMLIDMSRYCHWSPGRVPVLPWKLGNQGLLQRTAFE